MLAQQFGITKAYVTKITAALISKGIIREASQQDVPFGRPVTLLAVIPGICYSVNVLIRDYTLMATLNDYRTDIPALASTERTLEGKVSPESLVDIINEVTDNLTLRAGLLRSQVVQTSIALQGGIEQETGVVRWCPVLDTRNIPLKDMLQKGCRTGISVMNIAWCSCYMLSALYKKDGSWLAFMPGYGSLGFGYWLNGEPVLGENGFYPEIVHLPYTGGIENAFVFNASDPIASAKKSS
ncbi:ROK family protein [Pantoea tagorei]